MFGDFKMNAKAHSPSVNYAFRKVHADFSKRLSQLVPGYQVQEEYSQNIMGENMTYTFSIVGEGKIFGTISLTPVGVKANLLPSLNNISMVLDQEFSQKSFQSRFQTYKEEYDAIKTEIYQRMAQLPPLREVAELAAYVEPLSRVPYLSNVYHAYTLLRDGYTSDLLRQGLALEEITEIKNILEGVIGEKAPEIFTLEDKLK